VDTPTDKYNLWIYRNLVVEMSLTIPVKVVKIGNSLRMTIPKPVAMKLGIQKGDVLEVGLTNGSMIVNKTETKKRVETIFGIEKKPDII
jgi:AbrB family looped-hinge helix DNA binding protein